MDGERVLIVMELAKKKGSAWIRTKVTGLIIKLLIPIDLDVLFFLKLYSNFKVPDTNQLYYRTMTIRVDEQN
jgi:hypothetical protein